MYRLHSYHAKLLLFSTLISTIPIILLGVLFYFKFSQSIQDKVDEGNRHILEQTRLRVEQVLQGVDLSLQRLVDNKTVIRSMSQSLTPADFQFEQELASNLNQIQRFDFGLNDVALVGLQNGWLLSNYGLQPVNAVSSETQIKQYVNVSGDSYWTSEDSSLARGVSIPNERFVHLVKKIPAISERPQGLLIAEISTHELFRLLSQNNSLGEIFIFDGANGLLVEQNQSSVYPIPELQSFIKSLDVTASPSGVVSAEFNHHRVGVEYQKSSFNGWLYVSIVPSDEIRKATWNTSWMMLLGCLGLLLAANVISIQYSRRLYSPIQRLYDICFASVGQDQGGASPLRKAEGNEFDVINQNIANLQDLQTRLSQQLKGQIRQLEELFVLKLVQGEFKPGDIRDKLSMMVYDPPLEMKWMSVLVLQIDSLKGTRYDEKDRELLQFAVNNMVSDIVPNKNCLMPIIVQNHQVTILYTDEPSLEHFKQFMATTAERIEQELRRFLGLSISIGISRPYAQLMEAHPAFAEAKEALRQGLLAEHASILYYDGGPKEGDGPSVSFPEQAEKELLQAIKYVERDKLEPALERFFTEITLQHGTYIDYQASFLRLFADLLRLLQEADVPLQSVYGDNQLLFQQLYTFHKVDEIRHWLYKDIIHPMLPHLETRKLSKNQLLVQTITRMVEEEYDTEMTLELCASRLHYHPNYISRVLKNELGMNFSDYLAHYRLLMAKEMLTKTDAKISEIAEKLCYHNSQNFIRYFRKMEGMTPGKYRELHVQEKE